MTRQLDLFPTTASLEEAPAMDPESVQRRVRPKIAAILEVAQAATEVPWTEERVRVHAYMMQGMTNWLPPEERDSLRAAYKREMERLLKIDYTGPDCLMPKEYPSWNRSPR